MGIVPENLLDDKEISSNIVMKLSESGMKPLKSLSLKSISVIRSWNFPKSSFKVPLNLLLLKSIDCNDGEAKVGMLPEIEFFERLRILRCGKFAIWVGIGPSRLLSDNDNSCRFTMF